MPHGSHLVLAGRSDPPFSLSRMLANGGLLRIGVEELTMAEHEAEALLGQAEVQIDRPALESLVLRTEGWPAGLYLAAIALRESPDPAAAAERFAGNDRVVADYLHDEALRAFPDGLRDFMVRSSVLDRLSTGGASGTATTISFATCSRASSIASTPRSKPHCIHAPACGGSSMATSTAPSTTREPRTTSTGWPR